MTAARFQQVNRPTGRAEFQDCVVRALSNATAIDYETAHAIVKAAGRQDGKPASGAVVDKVYLPIAKGESYRRNAAMTVGAFIKANPSGRHIVRVGAGRKVGHVFAVVDGVMLDDSEPSTRRRVTHAWRIERAPVLAKSRGPIPTSNQLTLF